MPRRKRHGLPENCGYVPDLAHADSLATESAVVYASGMEDLKADLNRSAFPYRALAEALKHNPKYVTKEGILRAFSQSSHGSCVGCGEAHKVAVTIAAGKWLRGEDYDWPTDNNGKAVMPSRSWIYGASRQAANQLGRWEGSNGSWAAKAVDEMGLLFERKYGSVDLTDYRTGDCDRWEAAGVPRSTLEPASHQSLGGKLRIDHWEQLATGMHHGFAANICGCYKPVRTTRGEYGEIKLGSPWPHSQAAWAYVVYKLKPRTYWRGFVIYNSHGNKYKGKRGALTPDLPFGSYLCTVNEMQRILDNRDSWFSFDRRGLRPRARKVSKEARYASAC